MNLVGVWQTKVLPTLQVAVFKAGFGEPADPGRVPESEKTSGMLGAAEGGGAWRGRCAYLSRCVHLKKSKSDGDVEVPFQPGERMFLPLVTAFSRTQ